MTITISLVVPCYNEEDNLEPLYSRVCAVMESVGASWELVCVNDGSRDATLAHLVALHERDPRVVVVDLSRNFGKEIALTAGLHFARGDAAIPLDCDLQDPPELIPELIAKWREGYDIVNATRIAREGESWLKRTTAHSFYRLINRLSPTEIPRDVGDFRLISRQALDILNQLPERRRFMKGIFAWVGFPTAVVSYRREPRFRGKTSWSYWRLLNFAIEGITSFSNVPLRLASYLGLLVSMLAFLYAIWLIIQTLIFGNPVRGYPSLMVTILFLGGVQLIALGVIGEYLGRVYEESKLRPLFVVRKTWGGDFAKDTNRADDASRRP